MTYLRRAIGRAHRLLTGTRSGHVPPPGRLDFGDLRRLTPVSREWGFDRGLPIDRHYIEGFLQRHAADIRGRVLEVGDDAYTRRFGGDRVTTRDVLHVDAENPAATVIADLACADHVPSDTFDCVVLTQTLHLIYDYAAAVRTVHRILRPDGTLLLTVPGITPGSRSEWAGRWFWSFTTDSIARIVADHFPSREARIESHGNVLAASAFLYGICADELRREELDGNDPDYQVTVTVRVVKAGR
jgi:SAM-dependent methyltransferase